MRDLHNSIDARRVISPQSRADNTPVVGVIIDHQGYESAEYIILTGNLPDADATFTVLLEEGNDSGLSDAAAVVDADLVGTEAQASFTFADDNKAKKLGYIGSKRYTRLTITPANLAAGAELMAACCILSHPTQKPTPTL